jgi:hypothetical protein
LELDATAVKTQQQHQPVLSPLPKDDSRRKLREVWKWFLELPLFLRTEKQMEVWY